MEAEKVIELTFKVVMILAAIGGVWALVLNLFKRVKKVLFFFSNVEERLTKLEKRKVRRKPKTKTK